MFSRKLVAGAYLFLLHPDDGRTGMLQGVSGAQLTSQAICKSDLLYQPSQFVSGQHFRVPDKREKEKKIQAVRRGCSVLDEKR